MKTTFRLLLLPFLLIGAAALLQAQTPAVNHNTWTSGAAMPTPVVEPGGAAVLKNEIYVVGGMNSEGAIVADTQIYNPATNSWSTAAPLPTPTLDAAAAVVKNILYLIGGTTSGGTTNAVWAYNPKTNTWSGKAAMPTVRDSIGAVVKSNIIYVIGGEDSGTRLTTVESYNPATNSWTEEQPLLVGKSEPTIGLVGTTIVAADGYTSSNDTGDNEGYNVTTNTWESLKSDPTARNTAFGAGIGAELYVIGGYQGGGPGSPALTLNEAFKVSKNSWTTLAPMPQAAMFGASAVYKGQLYCIGGWSSFHGTTIGNVQIYQP
ncbi:MAG: kelch repeat-containing protein [Terriglobales bacterium]